MCEAQQSLASQPWQVTVQHSERLVGTVDPSLPGCAGSNGGLPPMSSPATRRSQDLIHDERHGFCSGFPMEAVVLNLLSCWNTRCTLRYQVHPTLSGSPQERRRGCERAMAGVTLPHKFSISALPAWLLGDGGVSADSGLPGQLWTAHPCFPPRPCMLSGTWGLALLARRLLSDCKSVESPFQPGCWHQSSGCTMAALGPHPGAWVFCWAHVLLENADWCLQTGMMCF